MEQVAEALKQLQSNGKWNLELQKDISAIVKQCEEEDFAMFESEVLAVLNAIISIYG